MPKYARKYRKKPYKRINRRRLYRIKAVPERKYAGVSQSISVDNNGTFQAVSAPGQGVQINQRIGNSIQAVSNYCRWTMRNTITTGAVHVRVMLIKDTQNQNGTPTFSDVLQVVGSADAINSPLNLTTLPRYKVLFDRVYTLGYGGDPSMNVARKFYKKIYKTIVKFQGATGTYKDGLFLGFISDVISSSAPLVSYFNRFQYIDV